MILNTNRIKSLDIAVRSQIHLAIRRDDLQQNGKVNIFNCYADSIEYDNPEKCKQVKAWNKETGSAALAVDGTWTTRK